MQKQKQTKNDIAGPMLLVKKYQNSSLRDFLKLYGGLDTGAFTDYTNLGVLDDERLRFSGATVKNAIGYSGVNKALVFPNRHFILSRRGDDHQSDPVQQGGKGKGRKTDGYDCERARIVCAKIRFVIFRIGHGCQTRRK